MRDEYEPTPLASSCFGQVAVARLVCPKCGHECRPAELLPAYGMACPSCLLQAARTRIPHMVSVPIIVPADVLEIEPLTPHISWRESPPLPREATPTVVQVEAITGR